MRQLIDWLMLDEQKELYEVVFALSLNLLFLALSALLLWPLGKAVLALRLAKGYGLFWIILFVTAVVVSRIQRSLRVDMYTRADAYVVSNLTASGFLVVGWSAFAALTVRSSVAGAPVWVAAILYLVGFLSSFIAFIVVGSFYQGQIYKLVNLPLALAGFLVFAVWPTGGRVLYGWFFDLF